MQHTSRTYEETCEDEETSESTLHVEEEEEPETHKVQEVISPQHNLFDFDAF